MGAENPGFGRSSRGETSVNRYLTAVGRSFKTAIVSVFVFSFFVNLLSLAVPLYLLQIYSKVLAGGNLDTLFFLTGIALAAVLALGLLEWIRRAVLMKLGVAFEAAVSEHLLNSAIHRAIERQDPSVNVMRDLARLRGFLSGSSMFPILDAPWTPLFLFILYLLHPLLGLIGLVGALLMLGIAILNEYLTREPVRAASRESRQMLDNARAYVRNADVLQAMGMQANVLPGWRSNNAQAMSSGFDAGKVGARLQSLSKLVRLFLQIGIICAAAWLIVQHQLTAGATIASVLLMRRAVSPLEQSIRSWKSVIDARSAFRNVSEYLDHASSLEPPRLMPEPSGTLLADRAGYRIAGSSRSLFSRVNLSLKADKITALVGPTAAGKSTLLRMMAGVVRPTSGLVTLDGFELHQWSAEQLGPHMGFLPQQVSLLPGSVRENIGRMADVPIEQVIEAAELANAHEMIQRLPEGYDTIVLEDGVNLSAGQRQRIGLARAVFGNPSFVMLDEPDANLDAAGRSLLRKALRRMRDKGMALLVITHHASLEKIADRVYRLDDRRLTLERAERPDRRQEDAEGAATLPAQAVASADTSPELQPPLPLLEQPSAQVGEEHARAVIGLGRSGHMKSGSEPSSSYRFPVLSVIDKQEPERSAVEAGSAVTSPSASAPATPVAAHERAAEPRTISATHERAADSRAMSAAEARMLRKLERRWKRRGSQGLDTGDV